MDEMIKKALRQCDEIEEMHKQVLLRLAIYDLSEERDQAVLAGIEAGQIGNFFRGDYYPHSEN